MRMLCMMPVHSYGDQGRKESYELINFFHPLVNLFSKQGGECKIFDFIYLVKTFGKEKANRMLIVEIKKYKPDYFFSSLYKPEYDPDLNIIKQLTDKGCDTINWFSDDHWRLHKYSLKVAPAFKRVITTDFNAVSEYKKNNIEVLLSQWACNPERYKKINIEKTIDVSFIGQAHGVRPSIIKTLKNNGINIKTYGFGWKSSILTFEEMIEIINRSKICLNFSESSGKKPRQIKGRVFEIPACGTFMITGYAPKLEDFYVIGKEIETYETLPDLISKIKYYIKHDEIRESIAKTGYKKTITKHTWRSRFEKIYFP